MLNLLDGLRDLKAPLASGVITLFGVWLVFANQLREPHAGESLFGNLKSLADFLGPAGTLGAVAFMAYVLGLIMTLHKVVFWWCGKIPGNNLSMINHRISHETFLFAAQAATSASFSGMSDKQMMSYIRKSLVEMRGESPKKPKKYRAQPAISLIPTGVKIDFLSEKPVLNDVVYSILRSIETEFGMLPSQLQAAKDGSYDLYDKNKTEADFRAAIVLPIWFVVVTLLFRLGTEGFAWYSLFGIVAAWIAYRLMESAVERLHQANAVILEAVVQGRVRIGAIEQLKIGESEIKLKESKENEKVGSDVTPISEDSK